MREMNGKAIAVALAPFIDQSCKYCKWALEAIQNEKRDTSIYGTMKQVPIEDIQKIKNEKQLFVPAYTLRPDRNICGHITHWHLDIEHGKEVK